MKQSFLRNAAIFLTLLIFIGTSALAKLPPPKFLPAFPLLAGPQIKLMWQPTPGAVKYNVYMNGEKIAEPTAMQHFMPTPAEEGEYAFQVAAVAENGEEGALSDKGLVKIVKLKPPKDLRMLVRDGELSLVWGKVRGAVIYDVYRSSEKGKQGSLIESVTELSYSDRETGDAKDGKTFYYTIVAKDVAGTASQPSEQIEYKIIEGPDDSWPKLSDNSLPRLWGLGLGVVDGKYRLDWLPVKDAVRYRICIRDKLSKEWECLRIETVEETTLYLSDDIIDIALKSSFGLSWGVIAENAKGMPIAKSSTLSGSFRSDSGKLLLSYAQHEAVPVRTKKIWEAVHGEASPSGKTYCMREPYDIEADEENNRIFVSVSNCGLVAALNSETGDLLYEIGKKLPGDAASDGFLIRPRGIALENGFLYVADDVLRQCLIFNADTGEFIRAITLDAPEVKNILPEQPEPRDVIASKTGEVYVLDYRNATVLVFSSEGDFLRRIGSKGGDEKEDLTWPIFLSWADKAQSRFAILNSGLADVSFFNIQGDFLYSWGEWGKGAGSFMFPSGLAFDLERKIAFVGDSYDGGPFIQAFSMESGRYLGGLAGETEGCSAVLAFPKGMSWEKKSGAIYVPMGFAGRVAQFLLLDVPPPQPMGEPPLDFEKVLPLDEKGPLGVHSGTYQRPGASCYICHGELPGFLLRTSSCRQNFSDQLFSWDSKPSTEAVRCYMCHQGYSGVLDVTYEVFSNFEPNPSTHGFDSTKRGKALTVNEGVAPDPKISTSNLKYTQKGEFIDCTSCHEVHTNVNEPYIAGYGKETKSMALHMHKLCTKCHAGRDANTSRNFGSDGVGLSTHPVRIPIADKTGSPGTVIHAPEEILEESKGEWRDGVYGQWILGPKTESDGTQELLVCPTCHVVHSKEGNPWLLAVGDGKEAEYNPSKLCVWCHSKNDKEGFTSVMKGSDHPIGNSWPGIVDGEFEPNTFYPSIVKMPPEWTERPNDRSQGPAPFVKNSGPQCTSCHDVHGGQGGTALLRRPNPEKGFCQGCHELSDLLSPTHPEIDGPPDDISICAGCHGDGSGEWKAHGGFQKLQNPAKR